MFSIAVSGIPLLCLQNFLPFFVAVTHCHITLLYCELLCQLRLVKVPPEVKRDLGLPMYDAPNAVEELKQPRKHPTVEKVEAIKDALKHFEVI